MAKKKSTRKATPTKFKEGRAGGKDEKKMKKGDTWKKKTKFLLLVASRTRESRSSGQYWTALIAMVVLTRPDCTMKSRLFVPKAPQD